MICQSVCAVAVNNKISINIDAACCFKHNDIDISSDVIKPTTNKLI